MNTRRGICNVPPSLSSATNDNEDTPPNLPPTEEDNEYNLPTYDTNSNDNSSIDVPRAMQPTNTDSKEDTQPVLTPAPAPTDTDN